MNWAVLLLVCVPLATFFLSIVWGCFVDPRSKAATVLGWMAIASFTWFVLLVLISVALA